MTLGPPINNADRIANRAGYFVQGGATLGAAAIGSFFGYELSQGFYEIINSGTVVHAVEPYNDAKTFVEIGVSLAGAGFAAPIGYGTGRWVRERIRSVARNW